MDIAAFKLAVQASRRFEMSAAGAKFQLLAPTEHAWRVALEEGRDEQGRMTHARSSRALLDASVTGWEGVTTRHIVPDAPEDEPLPFSPELRTLVLDMRQDIADELSLALAARMAARNQAREAARKN